MPRFFEVTEIEATEAERFVLRHHYSGRVSAGRWYFGLHDVASRGDSLVGVVVCGDGMPAARRVLPCPLDESTEVLRLVLLEEVAANAESWLVARCFDHLRAEGVAGVVSFSDPVPRTNLAGERVFKGHVGNVYQALSAVYTGRATGRTHRLLPDGSVFSPRTMQKIRSRETGWRYGVEQLVAAGAAPPDEHEDLRAWQRRELARVTRPLRHAGNFRYQWPLSRAARRHMLKHLQTIGLSVLPYPKLIPAPPAGAPCPAT